MENEFKFKLDHPLVILCSGEEGTVIGRAQYLNGENQYLMRYKASDGRAVENWWGESALEKPRLDITEA
ncbi:MAG: hypothetical protein KDC61_10115 [Saprospiraceae bacterium]|nr:hypothetical protein [Saprospiraceae bacterium]